MHLDQAAREIKPDAQARAWSCGIPSNPREHVENAIQGLARDPDAGIGDVDPHRRSSRLGAHGNRAAGGAVLGGIVQDIGEYLRQAGWIRVQIQRLFREFEGERSSCSSSSAVRSPPLRELQNFLQSDALLFQRHLAAGDPRDIQ